MRHLSFSAFDRQRHGGAPIVAGVIFAFGVTVGSRPATRQTFRQHCSMAAGRAATMAAGPAVGADSDDGQLRTEDGLLGGCDAFHLSSVVRASSSAYWTTTGVPTLTRPIRSVTSSLNMRMQP